MYGVLRQFQSTDFGQAQQGYDPDPLFDKYITTFMIKTRRLEYVFEKTRQAEEHCLRCRPDARYWTRGVCN